MFINSKKKVYGDLCMLQKINTFKENILKTKKNLNLAIYGEALDRANKLFLWCLFERLCA